MYCIGWVSEIGKVVIFFVVVIVGAENGGMKIEVAYFKTQRNFCHNNT